MAPSLRGRVLATLIGTVFSRLAPRTALGIRSPHTLLLPVKIARYVCRSTTPVGLYMLVDADRASPQWIFNLPMTNFDDLPRNVALLGLTHRHDQYFLK